MNIYQFSGDLGDCLSLLPVIRNLGGGEFILAPHVGPGGPREQMTEGRANFILPLIAAQPYITSARFESKPVGVTHDFSGFRHMCRYQKGELLTHWQARLFGIGSTEVDMSPWLTVKPSLATKGKVIGARSGRYHNQRFNWERVMSKYPEAGFIGLEDEYTHFSKLTGVAPHFEVADALAMAELIAGSDLFIGNQSFPCWVAMGLGHPLIQETSPMHPNSRVVRPNAKFAIGSYPDTLTSEMGYAEAYSHVSDGRKEHWELDLQVSEQDKRWADVALQSGHKLKWCAMHAGPSWDGRTWPAERWNEVARHLQEEGHKVLLVGHGNDMTVGDLDARERTTLGQLAAIVGLCQQFVGMDSLPLRVAAQLGVESLALLERSGDIPACVSAIFPPPQRSRNRNNPMLDITVESVVGAL